MQALLLIQTFALRHALPQLAIGHLLQLINILLPVPSYLPRTYHSFRKAFNESDMSVKTVMCCSNVKCRNLVMSPDLVYCEFCNTEINNTAALQSGTFFLSLSLADQIRNVLETNRPSTELHRSSSVDNSISDIQDGTLYKGCNIDSSTDISLVWNTDGVPLFKCSMKSFWPVRCIINELPYDIARKEVLISSLWFGKGKPNLHAQLSLFVQDIKELNQTGITWKHPTTGVMVTSKVLPIISCCDAVARCAVQGIHQFNGSFGCSWCLDEGEVVERGDGVARVYPFRPTAGSRCRTHASMLEHAQAVTSSPITTTHVMGVKSVSPLFLLESYGFDMVQSFNVDYMHCVLLGCVRQFLDLWTNSKNHASPWYISKKMTDSIDARLLQIRPPSEITRLPRSITQAAQWKASECRSWLMHYSLFALSGNLPPRFLRHWRNLVEAVHYLLSMHLTVQGISDAKNKLNRFVVDVEQLYDLQHVSYNVHQLVHIADCVQICGPLWRTSAFPFESHNQKLLQLFNGTNYITQQISHQLIRLNSIECQLDAITSDSPECAGVRGLVQQWLRGYPLLKNAEHLEMDTVALGRPHSRAITAVEKRLTEPLCAFQVPDTCNDYNRALIRGKPYCIEAYGRKFNHNDYTVELSSGSIAIIVSFICFHDKMFIMEKLCEQRPAATTYVLATHMKMVTVSETLVSLRPNDLIRKCVNVAKVAECMLMSIQPNSCESD